jgi:quercetin dioxygenase-like cupin family protein
MDHEESQRMRQHPTDRFADPQHQFDLEAVAAHLRQEVRAGTAGHRQESLYKHGLTTVALFIFGPQRRLPPHRTNGTVTIHVLKGRLAVTAEGRPHDLGPGGLLVMAAGVEHDVVAMEESEMLLTVHLETRTPAAT